MLVPSIGKESDEVRLHKNARVWILSTKNIVVVVALAFSESLSCKSFLSVFRWSYFTSQVIGMFFVY